MEGNIRNLLDDYHKHYAIGTHFEECGACRAIESRLRHSDADAGFREAMIAAAVDAGFDGDDNPGESPSHALISWMDAIIEELPVRYKSMEDRENG